MHILLKTDFMTDLDTLLAPRHMRQEAVAKVRSQPALSLAPGNEELRGSELCSSVDNTNPALPLRTLNSGNHGKNSL